jgi:hypothetical protein
LVTIWAFLLADQVTSCKLRYSLLRICWTSFVSSKQAVAQLRALSPLLNQTIATKLDVTIHNICMDCIRYLFLKEESFYAPFIYYYITKTSSLLVYNTDTYRGNWPIMMILILEYYKEHNFFYCDWLRLHYWILLILFFQQHLHLQFGRIWDLSTEQLHVLPR